MVIDCAQPACVTVNEANTFHIQKAASDTATVEGLCDLTLDCVEGGASIGFMSPLPRERAREFWLHAFTAQDRGERHILVAKEQTSGRILGTVQLLLHMPDNQPHRADVAKMQVHSDARRQGIGEALVVAIEAEARRLGKTLLVLDTVTGSAASRLYSRLGWQRCGDIPNYALFPQGGLCSTTVYYRVLDS